MIEYIGFLLKRIQQQQQRRLVVLGGEKIWCYQQLQQLVDATSGDWIGLDLDPEQFFSGTRVQYVKKLLGHTIQHAVIDLQQGFNVTHLAILAGALKGGSLLVLLTPAWQIWPQQPDNTVLQWGDVTKATATPNFIRRVQQVLDEDDSWFGWFQNGSERYPRIDIASSAIEQTINTTFLADNEIVLTQEQLGIYQQMTLQSKGYFILTAARGRGKSTLSGKIADFFQKRDGACWVTALQKNSAQQLLAQTSTAVKFWAPDELIRYVHALKNQHQDQPWLIVEEAASFPLPLLKDLASLFDKILFVTTLQGYEGSGQGFLLKFLKHLPTLKIMNLTTPIRWSNNDPLEKLVHRILLLEDQSFNKYQVNRVPLMKEKFHLTLLSQKNLIESQEVLQDFFQLLIQAHYRTTPLDLRRLLDAPYAFLLVAFNSQQQIIAGCWSLNEGNLSTELQKMVLVGWRRPRGNLVPQTLLAHGQSWEIARLAGVRITRLVVETIYQRQGIATAIVQKLAIEAKLQCKDYLSACFGYTRELAKFWQQCGFELIHIGTQRDTKSGCYSAIFIYPLNQEAKKLIDAAKKRLQSDWYWLQDLIKQSLPIDTAIPERILEMRDWYYLTAFSLGQRTIYATYPNLMRLSLLCPELKAEQVQRLCHKFDKVQALPDGKQISIKKMRLQVLNLLIQLDKQQLEAMTNWLFNLSYTQLMKEMIKLKTE